MRWRVSKKYFDERLSGTEIVFTFDEEKQLVTYTCEKGHVKTVRTDTMAGRIYKFKKFEAPICAGCQTQSKKEGKLEEARKVFIEGGCVLLAQEYINNRKLLEYQCFCGNIAQISLANFSKGIRCMKCSRERIRLTCQEKFGTDCPMQNQEIKEKVRLTCQSRYGVDCSLQDGKVREKIKTTCQLRFGVNHSSQSTEVKEKVRLTCQRRFGLDYSFQAEEVKVKGRLTCQSRYGVNHPSQNKEIFQRQQASSYRLKSYTCPQGTLLSYQGYEDTCLDILLGVISDPLHTLPPFDESIILTSVDPIPYTDPSGTQRYYHPDIIVLGHLVIEVKSFYTFNKDLVKNLCKFRAASQRCTINFQVWIIDKKQISTILSFREGRIYFSCGTEYLGGNLPQVVFDD